jgi:hypothetical protein
VKDLLTMALESEVAGLDHAGMHRSNADFVYLFASDLIEDVGLTVPAPSLTCSYRS